MKVLCDIKCIRLQRPGITMFDWASEGNHLGNGYCLKGSEMVRLRIFFENQARLINKIPI